MEMPMQTGINPPEDWELITPSDTAIIAAYRALYIGGAGNLRAGTTGTNDTGAFAVQAGAILPGYWNRVYSTNTTATQIYGLR
jgi:hypothetical protein